MLTFAMRKRQSKWNRSVHQTSTCCTMCSGSTLVCLLNITIHWTEWLVSFRGRWVGFRLARGSCTTLPFTRRSNIKHTWTVWRVSQTATITAAERMFFCAGSNHGWEVRVRRSSVPHSFPGMPLSTEPNVALNKLFFLKGVAGIVSCGDRFIRNPTLWYIYRPNFSILGTSHPHLTTTDCSFSCPAVFHEGSSLHQFIPNGVNSPCSLRDCDFRSSLSTM